MSDPYRRCVCGCPAVRHVPCRASGLHPLYQCLECEDCEVYVEQPCEICGEWELCDCERRRERDLQKLAAWKAAVLG